jgi:hypothetical protein
MSESGSSCPPLPTLNGTEADLETPRGKKVVLFMWGSWSRHRHHLPGWQHVTKTHRDTDFSVGSDAVEHSGSEAARSFVEGAGATFLTRIDEQGALSRHFSVKVVPNGVLVNEQGAIRWAKFDGFSI